jgi:DNA-binding LacI/PurR family transcriptional regulator
VVTIKDVAKAAGVSKVTVSNVINGNYKNVSAETIEKINKIIKELNYIPNATARCLTMKTSKLIGVVIPYISNSGTKLHTPYNAEIIGVLEEIIRMNGYYLLIRCVDNCMDIIPTLNTWNVDGAIFMGVLDTDVAKLRKNVKIPMVFIDTYYDGNQIANVGADDFKGGYIATKYLINNGHKHICFVGPEHEKGVIKERFEGYCKAMTECGYHDFIREECVNITSFESGIEIGKKLAFDDKPVTAVFTTADIIALGVMEGFKLSGKRVPEDYSVIGFDNLPECQYSTPKLTSINQNMSKKAERAAELLFSFLKDKCVTPVNEIIPVDLIERQSVRRLII